MPKEKRVIIAGSRTFNGYEFLVKKVQSVLSLSNNTNEKIIIVSGGANGADKLGERFAKEFGYELEVYKADWEKYGKRAGYVRNEEMAKVSQQLIAFHDGKSKGTLHMIGIARKMSLDVCVVRYTLKSAKMIVP